MLPTETQAEALANMARCGDCGSPMMAVGARLFCTKPGCSMYQRGVDGQPLPRRLVPVEVITAKPPRRVPMPPADPRYPGPENARWPWCPAAPLDAPGIDCVLLDTYRTEVHS